MKHKYELLLEEAATAAKEARIIHQKAVDDNRELTAEERTAYQEKYDLATTKKAESEDAKKDWDSQERLRVIVGLGDAPAGGTRVEVGSNGKSFGDAFIQNEAYQAFHQAHPMGLGKGAPVHLGNVKVGSLADFMRLRKTSASLITSELAELQAIRLPTVDQVVRPRLTLLDLVTTGGRTDGDFEYLQVTAVNRNAAIVPEATAVDDDDALKPVSDLTTELGEAKVYTYADGFDVTNKLLSRAPALAAFMNNELEYSINRVIEDKLLNGGGGAGEPTGLEHTSGTQEVSYNSDTALDKVIAIRKAITKITDVGGDPTGILMNSLDDEAIDLMMDLNERFMGQGPFGTGPQTLWARARAVSTLMPEGDFWVGAWKQMELLDAEGLSVTAFNQHKDYAQRNLVYVRGELSAAQVIWKPAWFCKVTNGS